MSESGLPQRDSLATRLTMTFATELDDSHRQLVSDTLALERNPSDAELQRSVFRIMHTLKGAARAAGVPPVEALCHAVIACAVERHRAGNVEKGASALLRSRIVAMRAVVSAAVTTRKLTSCVGVMTGAWWQAEVNTIHAITAHRESRMPTPCVRIVVALPMG